MPDQELDLRTIGKPDRHPAILQSYDALAVGESLVLVDDHDPAQLRDEFDTDHGGSHRWESLENGPDRWRVQITKLAATPLPRVLCDAAAVAAGSDRDAIGAVWKLQRRQRDLDSNIVRLPPDTRIDAHTGPDIDVLLLVLDGAGQLITELDTLELHAGLLVWLPRRSRRLIAAGAGGLGYLTVHQRRRSLVHQLSARQRPTPS